jgi:hypothetical protein
VPIYGLQTLAAVGLALLLRLNKPLILASHFHQQSAVAAADRGCLAGVGRLSAPWIVPALASGIAFRLLN